MDSMFLLEKHQSSVNAKVVDLESEEALPPNKMGELWLQGPNLMKGYLNNSRATLECITCDGWFKTGDLGNFVYNVQL